MSGILLTQSSTFIIGDVARILGWIMDKLFIFVNNVFGIQNIGLCIILFTIIMYLLMMPLTVKQQKFSKLSAKMNPEIQAIQKKYKNKKDQNSMMAMQEETKAVYAKYGVSPSGSCVQLLIQMPILFALYQVIMNVPAYVNSVKEVFVELANKIIAVPGGSEFMQELATNGRIVVTGKDYNELNTIIDVLYKLQDSGNATWQMLIDKFPEMESLILNTQATINEMNNFGINIANSPWNTMKSAFAAGAFLMVLGALLIPLLAGLTQWLNVAMMPQPANNDPNDTMAQSMKSMNTMMPLMSVWFCFTLPAGLGLYWIMGAVVRAVQQWGINKYLDRLNLDEVIKQNIEKNNRIVEKRGAEPQKIGDIAKSSAKTLDTVSYKKDANEEDNKPKSIASKAAMVSRYNEKNKK